MFSWDPKSPQHQDTCNFWMFGPWNHLRNHLRPFFVYTWDPAGGTGLSRFCDISRCRLDSVTWLDSARPQKHNDTMQADFLCIRSLQFYQVDPAQAYWRKVRKACIFVGSLVLSSINANECLRKPLRTMWDFKIYNLKYISLNILNTFGKPQAPNHWEKHATSEAPAIPFAAGGPRCHPDCAVVVELVAVLRTPGPMAQMLQNQVPHGTAVGICGLCGMDLPFVEAIFVASYWEKHDWCCVTI